MGRPGKSSAMSLFPKSLNQQLQVAFIALMLFTWLILRRLLSSEPTDKLAFTHPIDIKNDVLIFFHIQKTGGTTFNSLLVNNLDIVPRCYCTDPPQEGACRCRNVEGYTWLFSRFTTSSSCGVPPPLLELERCARLFLQGAEGVDINSRRFMSVTLLRDPVLRYLSEWQHVSTEGQWPLTCKHRLPKHQPDYSTTWKGIGLDEFMKVMFNPAEERQTRMLAANFEDSACVNSTDSHEYRESVLKRGKEALANMAYFGLLEYFRESQILFEKTFGVRFDQYIDAKVPVLSKDIIGDLDPSVIENIRRLNSLDVQLYDYAETLFLKRYQATLSK